MEINIPSIIVYFDLEQHCRAKPGKRARLTKTKQNKHFKIDSFEHSTQPTITLQVEDI